MKTLLKSQFQETLGINEAKKLYKKLAKQYHPDKGGTDEAFKILLSVYTEYLENYKEDKDSDIVFDKELEKVISEILHYDFIDIEVVGSWIWLSGDTKQIKEHLKKLGFKWASKKMLWYYGEMKHRNHKPQDMDMIRYKYGSVNVSTTKAKYLKGA